MFLTGRVATDDSTPVPYDVLVERICDGKVRQEVYADSRGDFSMQLGAQVNALRDDPEDRVSPYGAPSKVSMMGIPRRALFACELRASASGFHPGNIYLMELDTFGSSINVGAIVVRRASKIEGTTLSATPYKAPKQARRAYEKGLDAENSGHLADARKLFEKAVKIYPKYANAWFQLGTVLQKQNQTDGARAAYTRATATDTRFLPPYLALALIAYSAGNWTEVVSFTGHIFDLLPTNQAANTSYTLDLDPVNYAAAYFYNAVANYKLNKIDDAERSALKAEHVDLLTLSRLPRLHLLLAEIYARKHNYAPAISEIRTYLELVPQAKDADRIRAQLAELEKLNASASTGEKPGQK